MRRCPSCGAARLVSSVEDRPLLALPSVTIRGVKVRTCGACGEEVVAIARLDELLEVVAETLVHRPGRLSGEEVRFLRKHLGWSGRGFARRFGLTPEHVSRIENGHSPISVAADRLLRIVVSEGKAAEVVELGLETAGPISVRHTRKGWRAA